jgi:hypothetical protein
MEEMLLHFSRRPSHALQVVQTKYHCLVPKKPSHDSITITSDVEEMPVRIALMMEAISTSETSVKFHETTQRNIPEYSHLQAISWSAQ